MADSSQWGIPQGRRVTLHSLKARPDLNGGEGEVVGFNEQSGRYTVQLHPSGEQIALKSSNLHVRGEGDAAAFAPGAKVVLRGLVSKPELNGCGGTIQEFDASAGRYVVLLDGKLTTALYKAANLEAMAPSRRPEWEPTMPDANAQAQIEQAFHDYVAQANANSNPLSQMGISGDMIDEQSGGIKRGERPPEPPA